MTNVHSFCYILGMIEEYLTINETARKLKVHPNTIRNAIKKGWILGVRLKDKPNSHWRIPAGELTRIGRWGLKQAYEALMEEENI